MKNKYKKILKNFNFKKIVEKASKNPEYQEVMRNWHICKYLCKTNRYGFSRGDEYFKDNKDFNIMKFVK